MFNFLFGFLVIIGALIAAAYICDRLGIGVQDTAQRNTEAATVLNVGECARYERYTRVMIKCVANNHSSCGLSPPKDIPQHMEIDGSGIAFCNGRVQYKVIFDREILLAGRGECYFNTISPGEMVCRLNSHFYKYCVMAGLAPMIIVNAYDMDNGRVAFVLGRDNNAIF